MKSEELDDLIRPLLKTCENCLHYNKDNFHPYHHCKRNVRSWHNPVTGAKEHSKSLSCERQREGISEDDWMAIITSSLIIALLVGGILAIAANTSFWGFLIYIPSQIIIKSQYKKDLCEKEGKFWRAK